MYEPEIILQDLQNCKWKENLGLIFQSFLLTRITSQSEIQQQYCTLEFKANPVWALWSVLLCLFERKRKKKRGGGKKDAVTVHSPASSWAISLRLSLKRGTENCRNLVQNPSLHMSHSAGQIHKRLFPTDAYMLHDLRCCRRGALTCGAPQALHGTAWCWDMGCCGVAGLCKKGLGAQLQDPPGYICAMILIRSQPCWEQ